MAWVSPVTQLAILYLQRQGQRGRGGAVVPQGTTTPAEGRGTTQQAVLAGMKDSPAKWLAACSVQTRPRSP